MSKRAVDTVFQAMFILTDLRAMLRETAPLHEFNGEQRKEAEVLLEKLQKQVDVLQKELIR